MPLFNPTQVNVSLPTAEPTNSVNAYTQNASTTSIVLSYPSNNRKGLTIWNDSSATLYLDYSNTVSASNFAIKILPDGSYEVPFGYTEIVYGVWEDSIGRAFVREFIFYDLSSQ